MGRTEGGVGAEERNQENGGGQRNDNVDGLRELSDVEGARIRWRDGERGEVVWREVTVEGGGGGRLTLRERGNYLV